MKAFRASILFSVAVLLAACHQTHYTLCGTVNGLADGDTLLLTTDMTDGVPSDTAIVSDGKFRMEGETDSVCLAMIYSAKRQEVNVTFFLDPGNTSITLSAVPGNSRVGGTTLNDRWQQHLDSVMVIGKEINRIAERIYSNNLPEAEQQKGMEQIEQLNNRFGRLVVKTTEKNIDNEFGYFLLTYYPEELIDMKTRSELITKLPAEMQQRPAILQMKQVIATMAKTAEGTTISDFSQPAPDGSELSIMSEIQKNKITVIDFWASWCGPCRQEMPFMIELYNQYKDKGLGIVGISLDQDHDAWVTTTAKLGITWPQMSDLQGWDNAAAKQFNVTSIPHTIVVDQSGKILRRGLRGQQLASFIAEQLK